MSSEGKEVKEKKSEHKSVKAGGEVSKEATALIRGIQHQIKYYLGQVHVSTNDYNVYRHKELKELKGVGEVFNTYKYTKFVSEKCRDICDDIDKKMAVPKGVEPYVAKEYSPMAFAIIRRFFGVSDREMMRSICGDGNLTPPNIGAGKSGSLFMFTKDSKYILKVIPKREEKILVKVLPKYFAFIQENPQTLIPRFYGMYRIKPKHGDEYRYVVMNNLFPNTQFPLQFKFDLKGSLYGRKADENERGKKSPCYKDIDFLDQKAVIKIGPNLVNAFKTQVEKDSELMSDMHLIDYSLLVGVHQLSDTEMETAKNALDKQKQRNSKKSQHKHKHKHNKKTHNKSIKDENKIETLDPSSDKDKKTESQSKSVNSEGDKKAEDISKEEDTQNEDKNDLKIEKQEEHEATNNDVKQQAEDSQQTEEQIIEKETKDITVEHIDSKTTQDVQEQNLEESQLKSEEKESETKVDEQIEENTTRPDLKKYESVPQIKTQQEKEIEAPQVESKDKLQTGDIQSQNKIEEKEEKQEKKSKDKKKTEEKTNGKKKEVIMKVGNKIQVINAKKRKESEDLSEMSDSSSTAAASEVQERGNSHNSTEEKRVYRPRASTVFVDARTDTKTKTSSKKVKDKVANPEDFLKSLKIPKPEDFIFVDYEGGLLSRDANGYLNGELYFIGIIDILMDYTTRKKLETVMKGAVAGGVDQVSSVSPQQYSKRFIKFVHDHTN